MVSRRSSDVIAALVAAGFLPFAAWGNALALLVASAVGLVIGLVFFRWGSRHVVLGMLIGAVIAAAIAVLLARHPN